jgi:ATP-dependent DNA helicase RecQ
MDAIQSVLNEEDSLVVMPTGGGKSLCYQIPALAMDGMAVIVSPLISLMKDQVDFLVSCGIEAACINSSLSPSEKREIDQAIQNSQVKILYVAPERLTTPAFIRYLQKANVSFFAIDEAHCISHWGHDFRPHYRQLSLLKEQFQNIPIHAYTATATKPVREDICKQLEMDSPSVYVGDFHRPNLVYSVERQSNRLQQVLDIVERFSGSAGVVYCHSRKKVEETAEHLVENGHAALPYHAGLDDWTRKNNQDAFAKDETDIIVATVAFGMGIDKSNVRYVIHAGMPKSLEHYQQESGRAGRDGLESECILLYSKADHGFWRRMLTDLDDEAYLTSVNKLDDMNRYSTQMVCRHKQLVEYFGQTFLKKNCEACDVCSGSVDSHEDSQGIAQLILEGVQSIGDMAGPSYTTLVLYGSSEERILNKGDNTLPCWGSMSDQRKEDIRDWVEQLAGQGYLKKSGEYSILSLTPSGFQALNGDEIPLLQKPTPPKAKKARKQSQKNWEGVDKELFEQLRLKRLELAQERSQPAYTIFNDATLRDMTIKQPQTYEAMLDVQGIGEKKCHDFGGVFLQVLEAYRTGVTENTPDHSESLTYESDLASGARAKLDRRHTAGNAVADLIEQGILSAELAQRGNISVTKAQKLMEEYFVENRVTDPSLWISPSDFNAIEEAVTVIGSTRLKPIHEYLEQRIDFETIKISLICLRNKEL